MTTISERAAEARRYFHTIERGDETIWTRTDDAPQWVEDLTYHAHGDMGPDDWRYRFIVSALSMVADGDDADDVGDYSDEIDQDTDIYNGQLYAWLASNLTRACYVDEITEEVGHSDRGISGDIAMGQYREREETLGLVLSFLAEFEDDEDDAQEVATCRHCGRAIVNENGRWVDPEAPATPEEGDDYIWRETCDKHDTFTAEHEPEEQ